MIRYGVNRNGIQRIGCRPCAVTVMVSRSYSRTRERKPGKYRLAAYLLGTGKSTREVEAMIGLSKKTVNDIRKSVVRNLDVLCGCGQEAGHKGWCSFRYKQSPERQAIMARWGRPPKQINMETVLLLRAQGKPVREIAAMFKVDRNTINRRLAEYRNARRMPPWFCVGILNTRTALAIKRYFLMYEPMPSGDEQIAAFSKAMARLWKAARDAAGCPTCGAAVRKYSNSECRRCITLRLTIERAELAIAGTIHGLIYEAAKSLRDFADSLAEKRGLRPAQRLNLLLRRVSGTRDIQTQS